jgi:hypothetical protein
MALRSGVAASMTLKNVTYSTATVWSLKINNVRSLVEDYVV